MTSESNITNVRRLLAEAFSQGKYAVIDEIVAPDCVEHQNGSQGTGPKAVRRTASSLRSSFPDLHLEVQDVVATDDTVWVRVRGRGTDTGGVAGRPPSGRAFEIDIIDIVRFRDGKMVDHWGVADRLGMLQQVGVMPAPGELAA
ncbi:MAG TPA: ester cyclase [Thermoleophilia bacterium]|nr:ester cyclase [Thermoleophilia bacterium]